MVKKDNTLNLYAAYKKSFSIIIDYYTEKIIKNIKFYELMISDTFGKNDHRKKIINTLRIRIIKNKKTTHVSLKKTLFEFA